MKTVTINPSIAAIVNIDPVGYNELVNIYFTAETDWTGSYKFQVFNSQVKNTELHSSSIATSNELMTLTINANDMALEVGTHYYEIFHEESERVIFKGNLNIIK